MRKREIFFKEIQIVGLDYNLALSVSELLKEKIIRNLNLETKVVSSDDNMLAKAIKILKTYPEFHANRTSLMFLETAIDYENFLENIVPFNKKNNILINIGSLLVNLFYYRQHAQTVEYWGRLLSKKV